MKAGRDRDPQLRLPLGGAFVDALLEHPSEEVRALATTDEAREVFESVQYIMAEPCLPAFLHSALCAMALPVRRPKDEFAPIIRRDGNYSLIIRPLERMQRIDGEFVPVKLGVPFGALARLVLLFIMSEAVKTRSREIFLGKSFSAWLRRMGISNTSSGGSRGTRALVQEQVDRLMSCEWTIRWDADIPNVADEGSPTRVRKGRAGRQSKDKTITAFAVNDMRLVNQYAGVSSSDGEFVSKFVLSEVFYDNLIKHAVPMNERVYAVLRSSATQLDLYAFLCYRLPRIREGEEVRMRWEDLASHLGNATSTMFKFRQTVRNSWQKVSGVYQQARHSVDLDDLVVRLRYAPPPTDRYLQRVGEEIREISRDPSALPSSAMKSEPVALPAPRETVESGAGRVPIFFPESGSLRYNPAAKPFYDIALLHGSGNSVDIMADAFRRALGSEIRFVKDERILDRWTRFCSSFKPV